MWGGIYRIDLADGSIRMAQLGGPGRVWRAIAVPRPYFSPILEPIIGVMHMNRVKWLDRTALRLPHLALVVSEGQFRAVCRRMKLVDNGEWLSASAGAMLHHYTCPTGRSTCVVAIRLDRKRPAYETAGMLAHEAVHVKQRVLESIIEASPGREIEAYIVQNVVEYLMEEYARQMKLV